MTVSHTQRAGSTGLTHPVPARECNVVNALLSDLYFVRIDIPATSHAQAPSSCKVFEIDGIMAQEPVCKRNAHGAEARALVCSKMSERHRRERGGTSAAGMPGSGGAPKTFVFIGQREHRRELIFQNAHHAQARAPFCPPKMVLMTT